MRRLLLAVLAAAVAGFLAAVPAHAAPGDCKGDPPTPGSPYGLVTAPPANPSDGDPFANPDTVSIQSVYGTNFRWWTYDNGCTAGSDILPKLGTSAGALIGLEIPGLIPSWGGGLMSAVVNPTWTAQMDKVVTETSASATSGVWFPWVTVALLAVAVVTFVRSSRGQLPSAINGVVWALLVLVVVSWTISYPTESTKLLDSGIQTAVTATADGFSDTPPATGQSTAEQAQATLDHQWDVMVRSTLYRSWLQGAFGSADTKTAATYGPDLFKATHFTWHEWDAYQADPSGRGKVIVDAKATAFRTVAVKVETTDPVAYAAFTGGKYWDRVGIGALSLVAMLVVAWFMLAAAVIILLSYLLIRLVIPIAPVAGVFFLIDSMRDVAIGWLRKVAGLLVMGPLFFLAALVVARFNSAILASDLNAVLKLIFVGAVAVAVWRMLRPTSMLGQLKLPAISAVTSYFASRRGVADEIEEEKPKPVPAEEPAKHGPVFVGTAADRPTPPPPSAAEVYHPGDYRPHTEAEREGVVHAA